MVLDAIPTLRGDFPDTHLVVFTAETNPATARDATKSGALGYVTKDAAESDVVTAVRLARRGQGYVTRRLAAQIAKQAVNTGDRPAGLSPRELEILGLIARGLTRNQMAVELGIYVRTVDSHRKHIRQKTGLETRVELMRYAREHGLD